MPKPKYFSEDPNQLSLFNLCDNSQQSPHPSQSPGEPDNIELPQLNLPYQSTSKECHSKDKLLLVPDRFDVLERRTKHEHELKTIIVPVENTLAYLDDTYTDMVAAGRGASLVDLGILEERAKDLINHANTIGNYLAILRKELIKNENNVERLLAQERCKMWIVVIAGNNPGQEVATLSRVHSQADISCLMNSTKANIIEELHKYSDKVGILGTVLEAKIIYLPIATAKTLIINYADNKLQEKIKQAGMQTRKNPKATETLMKSDLAKAFIGEPRGLSRTIRPSRKTFEKLSTIAQKNDELLNRAIGKALQESGLVNDFKTEAELRGRINIRSDLLCKTDSGLIRLEFMWKEWVYTAEIASYVLKKLQNYGKAIGLLD